MKYHLEEEYEYDFDLYGISSHEKDYRICWAINNSLGLSLERTTENIEECNNDKPGNNFPYCSTFQVVVRVFKFSVF